MDLTISKALDTSDIMVFMEEASGDGKINSLNDTYSLSPILYAMAPVWIRFLIEPNLRYLASEAALAIDDADEGHATATMAGGDYGNIILLAYMYQKVTSDTDWMTQYYPLLQSFADYLVGQGTDPDIQLASDDGAQSIAGQTSLAIKSAIALNAFGLMTLQTSYSDAGLQFADILYNQGTGLDSRRTHFTLVQGQDDTWTLAEDLYMDILLDLRTFPSEAYSLQSAFYPTIRGKAGVSSDSHVNWGQTNRMLWAAAVAQKAGNDEVREMFVKDVHAYMSNGQSDIPFADQYFINNALGAAAGSPASYGAQPVVGGHFALMALQGPSTFLGGAETLMDVG